MTVWPARRRKKANWHIYCGRMVAGEYVCGEMVAMFWLPGANWATVHVGLTDEETPGIYRWSADSRDRMVKARRPRTRLSTDFAAGRSSALKDIQIPARVPCLKDHMNLIDPAALIR